MKNEPSNKEYTRLARYDLHRYRQLGDERCVLTHYRFLTDETETCILLDYDLTGPDAQCTIMGPNGRENVGILSLYIKKENVLPMIVNKPVHDRYKRLPEMEDDMSGQFTPNLKPSIDNPVYWIWWTIGLTAAVLAATAL